MQVDGQTDRTGSIVRQAWLVLADGGPARDLPRRVAADVRITASPSAFEDLLLEARPRLAIVDQPPAGTSEVRLAARERQRRASLRLMLLNHPDDVDGRLAALELGFDEALPSTIGAEELARRAALLAERPRFRPADGIPVGDGVRLDVWAHRLQRDDAEIHLRPKEFGLLALMASHPGRVYSRRELIERVWGREFDGDARTVDVHIRWLRSKIEPVPEHPIHLVTIRGSGYRLDP